MERIRGKHLFLFSGNSFGLLKPVAQATECELFISSDTLKLCPHKGIERNRTTRITWSVMCKKLIAVDAGEPLSLCVNIGQPFLIGFSVLKEELIAAGVKTIAPDGENTLVGATLVTSIRATGSLSGLSFQNITFLGNGELGLLSERNGFPYIFPIVL